MKPKMYPILVGLFLCSFCILKGSADPLKISVAMRQIGHRLLHSSGDSTSRVLPIQKKGENTFVISFEKQLFVSSDSLYRIVSYELGRVDIDHFVAELKACRTETVFVSFLFDLPTDSIAPCGGRNIPQGCYDVEITILKKGNDYSQLWWLIPVMLIPLFYFFFQKSNKEQTRYEVEQHRFIPLGAYRFDEANRRLLHDVHDEILTEKESKLLSLLLTPINEVQSRSTLMQALWSESGILVVPKNLDVLVSKLRKKLRHDESIKITNVHGLGYKLEVIG